jgi:serine-type D-Ala-D-Ala carboxypeptidase/endopeptidase (penicillin-binding protein 4)
MRCPVLSILLVLSSGLLQSAHAEAPLSSFASPGPSPSVLATASANGAASAIAEKAKTPGNPSYEAAVRAMIAEKGLKDAVIGVEIVDVDSGQVLAASGEHGLLNPASNAKVYTAACALATLHGNHRYQTTLTGELKGNSVLGLTVHGFGDPSLDTEQFVQMARELHTKGIRRIDGDITLDQRFFDEQSTPPSFEQQPNEWAAFRAPVSAIAVNENTVTLSVRATGEREGAAHISFDPPGFVDIEGSVKTTEGGADNVGLLLAPSGRRLKATVSGTISKDSKLVRYTKRVDDPELLAGYVLKHVFDQQGIKFQGDIKTGPGSKNGLLVKHESEPLSALLYSVGKNSDNFYAEMIFKSISAEAKGRPGKSAESADYVMKWLDKNGLSDQGLVIKNGSGLFDANRVTAHSIVSLLRYAYRDSSLQTEFLAQLAIGGVDGTLAKRFRSLRGTRVIRAKTGTLDGVIALSGYVLGPKGKGPIAFSVIFNKVEGKASVARSAVDTLAVFIAKERWKE